MVSGAARAFGAAPEVCYNPRMGRKAFFLCVLLVFLGGRGIRTWPVEVEVGRVGELIAGGNELHGDRGLAPLEAAENGLEVQTATPLPDGSVVHVAQEGQSLWSIATAYGVKIEDILRWNSLAPTPNLWPGDRLILQPSYTPAPVQSATATVATATSIATLKATLRSPALTPTSTAAFTVTAPPPVPLAENNRQWAAIGMIIFSALGLVLVLIGAVRRK